jgi:hypothetical protein
MTHPVNPDPRFDNNEIDMSKWDHLFEGPAFPRDPQPKDEFPHEPAGPKNVPPFVRKK